MLKNYLLIALRFMSKQRGFTVINVSGLTIGVACSLLLLLYVQDELTYDHFHRDAARTYRVIFDGKIDGKKVSSTQTAFPLGAVLKKDSSIESTLRLVKWSTFPVHYEGKTFTEKYLLLADSNFFSFFDFPLAEGDAQKVLKGERKVVLTKTAASRYFQYDGTSGSSPIGKTLELAQGYTATVSGIAEDPPPNSHIHFTVILSLDSWSDAKQADLLDRRCITYIKTSKPFHQKEISLHVDQKLRPEINKFLMTGNRAELEGIKSSDNQYRHSVQRLTDIHLRSALQDEIERNSNIDYIYIFSSIAIFITALACINFMNLTTAQSANRAKEVAVRKAVGAQNGKLALQFLLESYFYVLVAVAIGLFFLMVMLGPFNYFTGKNLEFVTLIQPSFFIGLIVFIIVTGLLAGSYPSFYLAQYNPVQVLKGNLRATLRTYGIRNILVVFQFFISASLIIATMIVYHQLEYIQRLPLGFPKENLINLLHTRNLGDKGQAFKKEILSHPEFLSASYCNRLPPNLDWKSTFKREGSGKEHAIDVYEVDYDHQKTLGFALKDGRFFMRELREDTTSIILNEKAASLLGVTDILEGKVFSQYDEPRGRVRQVIGIVKDFNFRSPREPIMPLVIIPGREPNWEMAIRIAPGGSEKCIEILETTWKKYAPSAPFEYSFVSDNFEDKVQVESRAGLLFLIFTILAILIACLGLLGLATFTADLHRKAIGIRKVLGATTPEIVRMLNADFLKLVLIANLLAWPTTGWIMNQWLSQFAFHISFPWWVFPITAFITVIIALFSVSIQAYKAASGNPVHSLRNE